MELLNLVLLLSALLVFIKEDKKEKISHRVRESQGTDILFPEEMIFTYHLTDIVNYTFPQSDYRGVVYVDSFG